MESDAVAVSHDSAPAETPPDNSAVAEQALAAAAPADRAEVNVDEKVVTDTALLVTQGKHRFYSLVLPSDVLAATCTVDPRQENPIDGFQRLLDKRRAREIAEYIDTGFGTAPCAVILSAQPRAQLHYDRASQLLRFRKNPNSFLIIDGQHRIYGFNLAKRKVSIPVVVYNKLTRAQECQLFMDINTKQRPVPPELLLDIRRLSETETEAEALLHNVFDLFCAREDSALKGLLSPSERRKGMISRVTFNAALKSIDGRSGLLSGQKARWKRSLNEAESQWLTWRDSECQDVAPFEDGLGLKAGDPRLSCMIDQDTRRTADLKSRYP